MYLDHYLQIPVVVLPQNVCQGMPVPVVTVVALVVEIVVQMAALVEMTHYLQGLALVFLSVALDCWLD
jgi:hypothetical protein